MHRNATYKTRRHSMHLLIRPMLLLCIIGLFCLLPGCQSVTPPAHTGYRPPQTLQTAPYRPLTRLLPPYDQPPGFDDTRIVLKMSRRAYK